MFSIGDKVVYPMQGAGIIEKIESQHILGEDRDYFVLKSPYSDMKIMIPVKTCMQTGVRAIISAERTALRWTATGTADTEKIWTDSKPETQKR